MSDQTRTAETVIRAVWNKAWDGGYDHSPGMFPTPAAQALYDDLLARLPEKKPIVDNLPPELVDIAKGYNAAIDDCKAILRAYFLAREDGAV